MRFMLLIYENEQVWAQLSENEKNAVLDEYHAFTDEVREAGAFVAADPLLPVATAKTCRVRNGQTLLSDGPFAETKEQLGGYYLLECKDIEEALRWAEKIPAARAGSIEVRQLMQHEKRQVA